MDLDARAGAQATTLLGLNRQSQAARHHKPGSNDAVGSTTITTARSHESETFSNHREITKPLAAEDEQNFPSIRQKKLRADHCETTQHTGWFTPGPGTVR